MEGAPTTSTTRGAVCTLTEARVPAPAPTHVFSRRVRIRRRTSRYSPLPPFHAPYRRAPGDPGAVQIMNGATRYPEITVPNRMAREPTYS